MRERSPPLLWHGEPFSSGRSSRRSVRQVLTYRYSTRREKKQLRHIYQLFCACRWRFSDRNSLDDECLPGDSAPWSVRLRRSFKADTHLVHVSECVEEKGQIERVERDEGRDRVDRDPVPTTISLRADKGGTRTGGTDMTRMRTTRRCSLGL